MATADAGELGRSGNGRDGIQRGPLSRRQGARADKAYQGIEPLTGDDVAEAVRFCATRPPHVNINDMIVMPQAQAGALVVHRT